MFSTTLGTVFSALIEGLAEADPARLQKILQDPSHELAATIASHQKSLGQILVQLDDHETDPTEQIGWLVIALAEIATCWHSHT